MNSAPSLIPPALDDLKDLHDIHLPPPVSWWPLAPGWWALLLCSLLLIAGLIWLMRRRSTSHWRSQALQELAALRGAYQSGQDNAQRSIQALSVLVRRVALSRFPRHEVAALHGEAWLRLLDQAFGGQAVFFSDHGRLLAIAPYLQEAQLDSAKLNALFSLCERWFKKLPWRGRR